MPTQRKARVMWANEYGPDAVAYLHSTKAGAIYAANDAATTRRVLVFDLDPASVAAAQEAAAKAIYRQSLRSDVSSPKQYACAALASLHPALGRKDK